MHDVPRIVLGDGEDAALVRPVEEFGVDLDALGVATVVAGLVSFRFEGFVVSLDSGRFGLF